MTETGDATAKSKATLKVENELLVTTDHECQILAVIIKGLKGEQHSVRMFNPEAKEPMSVANRAGNTDLEFNMNSHIRPYNQVFIVQTDSNDAVTAKALDFGGEEAEEEAKPKFIVPFTRPLRGFAKDCWIYRETPEDEDFVVFNICKSASDEYLNSDCIIPKL